MLNIHVHNATKRKINNKLCSLDSVMRSQCSSTDGLVTVPLSWCFVALPCLVLSCLVLSCVVLRFVVFSSLVLCCAVCCVVMSCRVVSCCVVLSSLVSCLVLSSV